MRLLSVLLWLPLVGCFQVDLRSGQFACDGHADCPPGLLCRDTTAGPRCFAPWDMTAPPMAPDLSTPAPPPDLADLRAPDLLPATPCSDGAGLHLGPGVWACKGNFAAGGFGSLCKDPGYHVCEAADGVLLEPWPLCDENIGFFATQVRIERVNDAGAQAYQLDCEVGGMPAMPFGLLGCGREEGARPGVPAAGACPRLPTVLRCDRSSTWTCPMGTLASATHGRSDTAGGGVLCCRNR